MIKYLVREVSRATADNPSFAGDIHVCLHGKGEKMLSYQSCHGGRWEANRKLWRSDIVEYGYSRLCDAKRNYTYNNPENTKFWTSTVEIVAFDIRGCE